MSTAKQPDERPDRAEHPARRPWHAPRFTVLDAVEGTGTVSGAKNDGVASHS
jgi:hypothetical protein